MRGEDDATAPTSGILFDIKVAIWGNGTSRPEVGELFLCAVLRQREKYCGGGGGRGGGGRSVGSGNVAARSLLHGGGGGRTIASQIVGSEFVGGRRVPPTPPPSERVAGGGEKKNNTGYHHSTHVMQTTAPPPRLCAPRTIPTVCVREVPDAHGASGLILVEVMVTPPREYHD